MARHPDGGDLSPDTFDALSEVFSHALKQAEAIAGEHALPLSCIKAIRLLATPLSMTELAKRMHHDPSFVTVIADVLERRGLARREPSAADRRIKNLVLTPDGLDLRRRLEQALLSQMPWTSTLSASERETLLALLRKMADAGPPTPPARTGRAETER